MKATKALAILAIAAIVVMGVGTYVLLTSAAPARLYAPPTSVQGIVSAYVIPQPTATTGQVLVNVLP